MRTATQNGLHRAGAPLRAQIIHRVRSALAPHQPRNYRLVADAETMEKRGDDWLVVVTPDREDAALGDVVTRIMAAEETLRRRWKIDIMLLPAMPPQDD